METLKNNIFLAFIAFLISSAFLFSCVKKEFDKVEYNSIDHEDVIPVGNSVLTIDKLVSSQNDEGSQAAQFYVKDDLYHLVYNSTRKEYIRDYYEFPDVDGSSGKTIQDMAGNNQELNTLVAATGTGILLQDETFTSEEFQTDFFFDMAEEGIEDAEITNMDVREGLLSFYVLKDFTDPVHEVLLDVRIPGIKTPSGEALTFNINVPSGETESIVNHQLAEHTIEFNQTGQPNELTMFFTATINGKSGGVIKSTDEIKIDYNLSNLQYELVEGIIGTFYVERKREETSINAFEGTNETVELSIKDPQFHITFESTLGVPADIVLYELLFKNKQNEFTPVVLKDNTFELPFIRNVSSAGFPEIEERIINNAETQSGNGISNAIETAPDKQYVESEIFVNGAIDPNFFLTYGSYLDLNFEVDLPLEIAVENYRLIDTLENSLTSLDEDLGEEASLQEIYIDIYTVNSFPFDSKINVYMIDENDQIVDTLGSDFIAKAPPIVNGETTGATNNDVRFSVSKEKYDQLVLADRMVLEAHINTPDNPGVTHYKIKASNRLVISVQAGAELSYNFE